MFNDAFVWKIWLKEWMRGSNGCGVFVFVESWKDCWKKWNKNKTQTQTFIYKQKQMQKQNIQFSLITFSMVFFFCFLSFVFGDLQVELFFVHLLYCFLFGKNKFLFGVSRFFLSIFFFFIILVFFSDIRQINSRQITYNTRRW